MAKSKPKAPAEQLANKTLKFGGDGLPDGTHTWFERAQGDRAGEIVKAFPGDEVPVADVKNPQGYLDRKQARVAS